jgi:hypothetical protein
MVCTADFLTFQMLVLIGADSFSFLIANLSGKVREFILSGKWQLVDTCFVRIPVTHFRSFGYRNLAEFRGVLAIVLSLEMFRASETFRAPLGLFRRLSVRLPKCQNEKRYVVIFRLYSLVNLKGRSGS